MFITKIELFTLKWQYPKPIYDALSKIINKTALLVKITTDEGFIGWGEAACFGEVPEIVSFIIQFNLFKKIKNKNASPQIIKELLMKNTAHYGQKGAVVAAISGLEIALWDILGKKAGLPISNLLGRQNRKIGIYAAMGYYTSDNRLENLNTLETELQNFDSNKFCGIKVKVGKHSISDDINRVELVRKHIGYDKTLIVDANNSYNIREAIELSRKLNDYNILFIEEPIQFGNYDLSRQLKDKSVIPIGGYELDCTIESAYSYINNFSLDYIQPDAIWHGGIYDCISIAEYAKKNAIKIVPHNFSTIISLASNYQILCSVNNGDLLEFDNTGCPFINLSNNSVLYENGNIIFNESSGLCIDIDENDLKPYLVKYDKCE